MMRKVLQVEYEPERDRLTWDGWDIHCGKSMEFLLPDMLGGGTFRVARIEHDDDWYLVGYPGVCPVGLWARECGS